MAVLTQDDMKAMMDAMTKASTAMTAAMNQIMHEVKRDTSKGHIDHRAIGGPPEWDSTNEANFLEWQIKVQAWLVNQDPHAIAWLKRATIATSTVETDAIDLDEFPTAQEREDCKKFNTLLFNILITKLEGEAFSLVSSVKDGCGFEAWRLLMKRYEPRTPATR